MIDYREILRLHSQNQSQRRIEANVHSSHQTVKAVLDNAAKYGISWPLDDEMTNEKLNEILSISAKEHEVITYAEPDYAYIHRDYLRQQLFGCPQCSYCRHRHRGYLLPLNYRDGLKKGYPAPQPCFL